MTTGCRAAVNLCRVFKGCDGGPAWPTVVLYDGHAARGAPAGDRRS